MSKDFDEVEAHQQLLLVGLVCAAVGAWAAHSVVERFKVSAPWDALLYGISMVVIGGFCFGLYVGFLVLYAVWSSRKEKPAGDEGLSEHTEQ